VTDASWIARTAVEQNTYIFAPDIYGAGGNNDADWSAPYTAIYTANVVLEGLAGIPVTDANRQDISHLKGQALFYRSWQLYNLLQNFSLPYDSLTARSDLGIPLRLSSDFNSKTGRASVQQCYDQVVGDLQTCVHSLPAVSGYTTRPTSVAANAMLARIYLAMGKYTQAFPYADAVLSQLDTLLDFNSVNASNNPISHNFLPEDIFHSVLKSYPFLYYSRFSGVDSNLYASYDTSDLRKALYFSLRSGMFSFKGTYDYNEDPYSGLATDEMYLIRAECYARAGNIPAAMNDLNTLLAKRWKKGSFHPLTAASAGEAVKIILQERRKELVWRGLRWTDLRRLNKETLYQVTLTRMINGTVYTLPPNSPLYALPIPESEILLSGITQNQRN
jgi:tetratricopeptide (TPR) repeat protein